MRRALAVSSLVLLGACAHTRTDIAIGGAPPGGGLVAKVQIRASSGAAALLGLGVLAAAAATESHGAGSSGRTSPFFAPGADSTRWHLPMDESRRVHEQDCRRPIADEAANLRCR